MEKERVIFQSNRFQRKSKNVLSWLDSQDVNIIDTINQGSIDEFTIKGEPLKYISRVGAGN